MVQEGGATKVKEGQQVWVKDTAIAKEDLYSLGHVTSINGDKVNVETKSSSGKSRELDDVAAVL